VATATCQRRIAEDRDTFLVTIEHAVASGPWQFRIQNNEPSMLAFNGFISHSERETLQPWMDPGGIPAFEGDLLLDSLKEKPAEIVIRNLGAVPLKVEGRAGDPLGSSPARIESMPELPILPHCIGTIGVVCSPLKPVEVPTIETYQHLFNTNDPYHQRIVNLRIPRHVLHPNRCRACSYCLEYEQGQIPESWELPPGMSVDDFYGLCYCGDREEAHGVYPSGWPARLPVLTRATLSHRVSWPEAIERAKALAKARTIGSRR
jgi:hypothetical protein